PPEDVIIVDVKGDLPYAPDLSSNIASVVAPGKSIVTLADVASKQDNAYNDYSSNPNGKYTYVRIEESYQMNDYQISINPIDNHFLPVEAALDNDDVFDVTVNGSLRNRVTLESVYIDLLKGNF
ncbi:MAG: hypothetical protein V1739_06820, partial [Candidatus Omnitrophota bacterium]